MLTNPSPLPLGHRMACFLKTSLRPSKGLERRPGCKTILSFQSEKKAESSSLNIVMIRFEIGAAR